MYTFIKISLITLVTPLLLTTNTDKNTTNAPNTSVNFHIGSFDSGKVRANKEGKLFFVEFYADWCTPCKWMDKTTFKDGNVVSLLNDNYVPLKMDIESSEGRGLKGEYSVRMLPTILIFNSQGRMIERVEKTLSSEAMVSLLSFHNNDENKEAGVMQTNSSPSSSQNADTPDLNHLYNRYKVAERFKTNYKLQVGNHMDYAKAFKQVKGLKDQFIEPIVVMNDYVDNKTHYKVLMGEFKTMQEAESFRVILKRDFDLDAIVY